MVTKKPVCHYDKQVLIPRLVYNQDAPMMTNKMNSTTINAKPPPKPNPPSPM